MSRHVAIIMDGNYRWAKSKSMPVAYGHKKGAQNIENIVKAAIDNKVEFLTLYAFSTENWNRPKKEVDDLMELLDDFLTNDVKKISQQNVRVLVSGDLSKVKDSTKSKIDDIIIKTSDNDAITLNIAFGYGARQELTEAFKALYSKVSNGELDIEDVVYNDIAQNFYQPRIPDPDLLIRTGSEQRISNFLLMQIAYSELYFSDKLWPDFSNNDFSEAINEFNQRIRKYGTR